MKVAVRVIGRPYRGKDVGAEFNTSLGDSRVLVATRRVELVDASTPAEAAKVQKLTQTVARRESAANKAPAKTVAKKAVAKKAPAKKAATKTVRGTQNRSMAGKTDAK